MTINIISPGHSSILRLKDLVEVKGSSSNGIVLVKLSSPFGGRVFELNQIPTNDDGSWGLSVSFNTGGDRTIAAAGFNGSGVLVASASIQIQLLSYTTLIPIRPLPVGVNQGLSSAKESTMRSLLGVPGSLTKDCSSVTDPTIQGLLVTENVGPFRVTGLKPALEALKRIFSKVQADEPELYSQLGTAGMLCCRAIRGSTTKFSNHSWGTAIDIKISSELDDVGDDKAQFGLLKLAHYFNEEKFFWGAGFNSVGREDSMHFEVSEQLIQDWKSSGQI